MQLPLATGIALAIVLAALAAVRNRFVRPRLGFAAVLLVVALGFDIALAQDVGDAALVGGLARLLLVAGGIVAGVGLLFNPWRHDRVSERVPGIVQDVIVIALFALAATLLLDEKFLTTSAVGAVVVGFALQDTLGNLFAGLAIQIEKPFRVGHWVRIGEFEGRVQEVTWRATKLLTKAGQFVIVPNSVMSKDPILNHSEPTIPTRIDVEIGASYDVPPNDVTRVLHEALDNAPLVLREPAPDVLFDDFGASALIYRVRFWIDDYGKDGAARDQVRRNIWYTFKRHGIEIPYPMQVEYHREAPDPHSAEHLNARAARLGAVDMFAGLDDDERLRLAQGCQERLFGAGERIVRQGDEGRSMFVVLAGRVRVTIEPSGQEVAVTPAGGVFGEMSMLTGDPRTATVTALDDAVLLEVTADQFRDLAVRRPGLVEHVSGIVSARRQLLAEAKAASDGARVSAHAPLTLLSRIKAFLKL
ncbi:MAG: mechanosensitive ion channel [Acidobacteria bacterium]|nr:mechanosensitive ion channel [Acidobacteriota bacterium]